MDHRERHTALRAMLEDRRREIQDKLRSIRETMPDQIDTVRDAEEQSVTDFVQEMDFAVMEMKANTLAKIDEALQRLEEGTYGTCAECQTEITEARLKAVPFATLCRACQERAEEEAAADRDTQVVRVLPPVTGAI
ncbi:MAG TPA: TraR/DksA C4-type zinc finger protein [Vicinamibacteria bacterium]|nr:TraR/DksA C4-type zinc finger protein [Vicinamibacteria bacterium]